MSKSQTSSYKQAGVDIEAGERLVDWLSSSSEASPHSEKVISGIGGFAALFRIDFKQYEDPLIVSCTDGVGTKVKLAADYGRMPVVAQDLVAMSVNDLICCGAEPMFFLDYLAVGKLELDDSKAFLAEIRRSCHQSGLALIGGETAEMPGVYQDKDFDCAGFAIGVVDRPKVLGAERVQAGDVLLGLPSTGFHSNGYSLVRRLFSKDMDQWVDQLLVPTALYPASYAKIRHIDGIHAMSHITGGGLDNIPRILPKTLSAEITPWEIPDLFLEAQRRGQMTTDELLRTFNCGVGLVFVVAKDRKDQVMELLKSDGVMEIGQIVESSEGSSGWTLKGWDA